MELSIVIVNFNNPQVLKDCLESIYVSWKKDWEVIVVDNASTDQEVIKFLEKEGKKKQVKTIFNSQNLGFSGANNLGVKQARGDYILLLNSDTVIGKGELEKLIQFAKEKKNRLIVAPCLLNKDDSIQASCYRFPTARLAFQEFWLGKKVFSKYAPKEKKAVKVDAVVGAAVLIPRLVIKKVGLLDEKYFFYFEDLDYCRQVWRKGFEVYYYPQAKIKHLHGATAKKTNELALKWLRESSRKYHGCLKHYLINFVIWSGQKWLKIRED